ncbi:MAG: rhodanese-like domain-containing protein [Candidatus Aenigmarchaeota archaeon]|nr:rhodanese-like domain-containing protein [Candidatus Aenigmarchaeota archaeon]
MESTLKTAAVAAIFGTLFGTIASFSFLYVQSDDARIGDFYSTENAVHVSPHSIRKAMDKGAADFILVDLRSAEEYEREHIIGAVSIPAYKDPDTSAYGDVERITNSFVALKNANSGKDIIVYCYSTPCMTGRKVGLMLMQKGIYVKHLGIGWNEWRYFWETWNHEHEWNITDVKDYISSGTEPGTPKLKANSTSCPIGGEFGC